MAWSLHLFVAPRPGQVAAGIGHLILVEEVNVADVDLDGGPLLVELFGHAPAPATSRSCM